MEWGKVSVPTVVLALLIVAVASAVVFAAGTSTASFSTFNDDWNGATAVRSIASETGTDVHVGRDASSYGEVDPDETVAFVLSPNSSYRPRDVTRMKSFVRRGGTLVVAGDFGPHANDLLRSLNASARLDGDLLRDPRSNYRSNELPVATNVTNHSLTAGVESLTLNYGTAVEPNGATTLVNTSEFAYLDVDGNGGLGENESLGRYPVVTTESVDEGRIVVVGDPSVFVNAMLERPGNRRFARVLLAQHDTLLMDYSTVSGVPPAVVAMLVVRESAPLQVGLGALLVGAIAAWSLRPRLFQSVELPEWVRPSREDDLSSDVTASQSDLAAHLERLHPDWERDRVERVVSAVQRQRNE